MLDFKGKHFSKEVILAVSQTFEIHVGKALTHAGLDY